MSLPSSIDVHPSIQDEDLMVWADPTQIYQVILNLCANAEYAMRNGGGLLKVGLKAVEGNLPPEITRAAAQSGTYVALSIHDTGHGIPPEVIDHIFDPFFTTKVEGEGSGMGLAIAHGIVNHHNGVIIVESSPDHGTTFSIYLPQLNDISTASIPTHDIHSQASGCILFIDDEVLLTRGAGEALTELGYEVITHCNPHEALADFASEPQRFDLVITDQTMPGMTGEALAQELRNLRSDISIILCTGFSYDIDAKEAQKQGIDAFCTKPLTPGELSDTIQEVLSRHAKE